MPSFEHEFLADLFRNDAKLALELLRTCAGITVEHARVATGSIDLSQVAPTGYYADAVVVLRDRADQAVTGVIVEVQREVDHGKRWSWPAYVANLRASLACAAVLLVVAPDRRVAAWARRPIELGHPGFQLAPIVVSFDDIPWLRDRDAASRLPELAVLSVLAHPEREIAEIAIDAIASLPEDRARLYLDVIMMAVPVAVRRELEAGMQHYEYRSEFARKYYGQGITEGLEKGRTEGLEKGRSEGRSEGLEKGRTEGVEKGRTEGLEKGRTEGLRAAVIALARTKLESLLSDADVAAVEAVIDPAVLTELVTALGGARSRRRARAALDAAVGSFRRR